MPKKTKLAEVFNPDNELQPKNTPEVVETQQESKKVPSARENKKHIGGYFPVEVYQQLKFIGVEKHMTTQEMLEEALNAWFRMNDKPTIAGRTGN